MASASTLARFSTSTSKSTLPRPLRPTDASDGPRATRQRPVIRSGGRYSANDPVILREMLCRTIASTGSGANSRNLPWRWCGRSTPRPPRWRLLSGEEHAPNTTVVELSQLQVVHRLMDEPERGVGPTLRPGEVIGNVPHTWYRRGWRSYLRGWISAGRNSSCVRDHGRIWQVSEGCYEAKTSGHIEHSVPKGRSLRRQAAGGER